MVRDQVSQTPPPCALLPASSQDLWIHRVHHARVKVPARPHGRPFAWGSLPSVSSGTTGRIRLHRRPLKLRTPSAYPGEPPSEDLRPDARTPCPGAFELQVRPRKTLPPSP